MLGLEKILLERYQYCYRGSQSMMSGGDNVNKGKSRSSVMRVVQTQDKAVNGV